MAKVGLASVIALMESDGDDQYVLTFRWTHNRSLPHPTQQDCNSDRKPSPVSHLVMLGADEAATTGLRSVSVDWYPCGHPPNGFKSMHYDVHMYYVSEEERDEMTCDSIGAVCSEDANSHFWIPMDENVIDGFNMSTSAVKRCGMHYYRLNSPSLVTGSNPWTWPEPMIGSYNGSISFFEVMVPLAFLGVVQSHTETLFYERRRDQHLPDSWSVASDVDGGVRLAIRGRKCGAPLAVVRTFSSGLTLTATERNSEYELTMSWRSNSEMSLTTPEICSSDDKPSPVSDLNVLDTAITALTGLRSVSIDWYPCGHPPNGYKFMHYDVHMYYVTEEQRNAMTCSVAGAVCPPEANAEFWKPMTRNMIAGFAMSTSAVKRSGMHYYNLQSPSMVSSENAWTWPEPMIGSYGGNVSFFEVMVPYAFKGSHEEIVSYMTRSDRHLPNSWDVTGDAKKRVSLTLSGSRVEGMAVAVDSPGKAMKEQQDSASSHDESNSVFERAVALPFLIMFLCKSV